MSQGEDTVYIRRDFIRDVLNPGMKRDGLRHLSCPESLVANVGDEGCGHCAVVALDEAWTCPVHGLAGVE